MPTQTSVSLPRFWDFGKYRTCKLLQKAYTAAQSFFILNTYSDDNVARNICQKGIEWVENRLLLSYY